MTAPGLPVGLHTLKAAALTEDKPRVEPIVLAMVRDGELIQLKKDRFIGLFYFFHLLSTASRKPFRNYQFP